MTTGERQTGLMTRREVPAGWLDADEITYYAYELVVCDHMHTTLVVHTPLVHNYPFYAYQQVFMHAGCRQCILYILS